jgi:hypothetical protein
MFKGEIVFLKLDEIELLLNVISQNVVFDVVQLEKWQILFESRWRQMNIGVFQRRFLHIPQIELAIVRLPFAN